MTRCSDLLDRPFRYRYRRRNPQTALYRRQRLSWGVRNACDENNRRKTSLSTQWDAPRHPTSSTGRTAQTESSSQQLQIVFSMGFGTKKPLWFRQRGEKCLICPNRSFSADMIQVPLSRVKEESGYEDERQGRGSRCRCGLIPCRIFLHDSAYYPSIEDLEPLFTVKCSKMGRSPKTS